jgi:hypothetical protein
MNKYEVSFNRLKDGAVPSKCEYRMWSASDVPFNEDLDNLKELVDKATPMKVIKGLSDIHGYCPKCNEYISITTWFNKETHEIESINPDRNYCEHCGQAVTRSNND